MNIGTIITGLENKLLALEAKKKVSLEKGSLELFNVFDNEYSETKVALILIKKSVEQLNNYTQDEIKNKLKDYLLEELPNLAFYFKEVSINTAVTDSLNKAFTRLIDEYFNNKIVSIIGQ